MNISVATAVSWCAHVPLRAPVRTSCLSAVDVKQGPPHLALVHCHWLLHVLVGVGGVRGMLVVREGCWRWLSDTRQESVQLIRERGCRGGRGLGPEPSIRSEPLPHAAVAVVLEVLFDFHETFGQHDA